MPQCTPSTTIIIKNKIQIGQKIKRVIVPIFNLFFKIYFHFLWTLLGTEISFWHHHSLSSFNICFYFSSFTKRLFISLRNTLALKVRSRNYTLSASREKHFRIKGTVALLLFCPSPESSAWHYSDPQREVLQLSHCINNLQH
jgi:hypothetical protein